MKGATGGRSHLLKTVGSDVRRALFGLLLSRFGDGLNIFPELISVEIDPMALSLEFFIYWLGFQGGLNVVLC